MRVIDSHTGGEPTRLVVEGAPDLGSGPLAERRRIFAERFDHVRRFVVNEPRGHEAMVGALLCEPVNAECAAGIIFFNNAGTLGMCGHGTIGAAATLAHMGRIAPGHHRFETPVGEVEVHLKTMNEVSIGNVPSYRHLADVALEVEGMGIVTGDVAWGGNWFFLCHEAPLPLTAGNIPDLTRKAGTVKQALAKKGITGRGGGEIDHIEFFARGQSPGANSRNFVLCPGNAYDRSPCGTGTSAKLACLAASGKLKPGETWVQESIIGSTFSARYQPGPQGTIIPEITGSAYVVSEALLLRHPEDPFADGFL